MTRQSINCGQALQPVMCKDQPSPGIHRSTSIPFNIHSTRDRVIVGSIVSITTTINSNNNKSSIDTRQENHGAFFSSTRQFTLFGIPHLSHLLSPCHLVIYPISSSYPISNISRTTQANLNHHVASFDLGLSLNVIAQSVNQSIALATPLIRSTSCRLGCQWRRSIKTPLLNRLPLPLLLQ